MTLWLGAVWPPAARLCGGMWRPHSEWAPTFTGYEGHYKIYSMDLGILFSALYAKQSVSLTYDVDDGLGAF